MADKKNAKRDAGQPAANGHAANGGTTHRRRKKLTKLEAVRRAMVALGGEATRADLQGYIRQKFGFEIGLDHISNCKSALARRASEPAPERAAAPAVGGRRASSADAVRLEDVLLAKELLDRVGAGPLRTLLDGLAK